MRKLWWWIQEVWRHFDQTGCNYRAASLAFTSLLSLVPLMTIALAILAAFPVFKEISAHLQDFIFSNFVPATGDVVQGYLTSFVSKAGQLSVVGLIFLIVTAIAMMFTMENTFNDIWQIKKRRRWISALMLYWTILTLSPLLLGAGFAISSYLASLHFSTFAVYALGLARPLLAVVPFLLSVLSFTLIYIAVPYGHVPVRYALIGAVIAGILFECAKHIFTLYVTHFATYALLYGALATIPVFLLWVYLCWLIALLGAVISYVLTHPSVR